MDANSTIGQVLGLQELALDGVFDELRPVSIVSFDCSASQISSVVIC